MGHPNLDVLHLFDLNAPALLATIRPSEKELARDLVDPVASRVTGEVMTKVLGGASRVVSHKEVYVYAICTGWLTACQGQGDPRQLR